MTKRRCQPENKFVVQPILKKLKWYVVTGDILWWQRLVAEDDCNCPAGTPDIVTVVNCETHIVLLFIECKKPSKKKPHICDLRHEQKLFFERMADKPKTLCVVINDPSQLWPAIKKARKL